MCRRVCKILILPRRRIVNYLMKIDRIDSIKVV
jgi:hypothetical protein